MLCGSVTAGALCTAGSSLDIPDSAIESLSPVIVTHSFGPLRPVQLNLITAEEQLHTPESHDVVFRLRPSAASVSASGAPSRALALPDDDVATGPLGTFLRPTDIPASLADIEQPGPGRRDSRDAAFHDRSGVALRRTSPHIVHPRQHRPRGRRGA